MRPDPLARLPADLIGAVAHHQRDLTHAHAVQRVEHAGEHRTTAHRQQGLVRRIGQGRQTAGHPGDEDDGVHDCPVISSCCLFFILFMSSWNEEVWMILLNWVR